MPAPHTRRLQERLGLVDQALSSGSNFVLLLLIAQSSSVAAFGWFTVMFGLVTVGLSVSRSALGVPVTVEIGLGNAQIPRLVAQSSTLAIGSGAVAAVALLPLTATLEGPPRTWAWLVAAALPVLVLQDLWRFTAVSNDRAAVAAIADGLWFLVILALWALNLVDPGRVTATQSVLGWLGGCLLAILVLTAGKSGAVPAVRGLGRILREPRRAHLSADALLAAGGPALLTLLVSLIAVPAVTGTWRGATTLMSPINVLLAAVPLVYLRHVTELGPAAALRACQRLGTGLVGVALCWALVLFLIPGQLGAAFMGETWTAAVDLLPFAAVETACIALWTTGVTLLRARQQTGRALKWRIGYAGLSLGAGGLAAATWGTAPFVAGALAASALVIVAGLWWSLGRRKP